MKIEAIFIKRKILKKIKAKKKINQSFEKKNTSTKKIKKLNKKIKN